jgi:DNA-nicking Smr family endonuclease
VVKKQKSQAADENLFRQEMGDVVPLKTPPRSDSKALRKPHRKPGQRAVLAGAARVCQPPANDPSHIDATDGSSHRKNGVQKKLMQKLKRGQFPIGGQLDMHHMSVATAHDALLDFIAESQSRSLGCVRIIHGKGLRSSQGPRLKLMAHQALRDHPNVLAFTTCKPADGGSGAVDVLLKTL